MFNEGTVNGKMRYWLSWSVIYKGYIYVECSHGKALILIVCVVEVAVVDLELFHSEFC